jgi:hypothetical protein
MTLESVIQITASCSRGKRRLLRLTPSGATGKRKCSGTHLVQHGAAKCALPTERTSSAWVRSTTELLYYHTKG